MMDFLLGTYKTLLSTLKVRKYGLSSFKAYLFSSDDVLYNHRVILRHDVDRLPQNALEMARLERELGICATYYFRTVPESFDEEVIAQIAELGHEIGYHYEDVDLTAKQMRAKGKRVASADELLEPAMELFEKNLEKLRVLYPVKTACMHGSPLSRYDNRLLWEKYDYRDYGIIGEPYFDLDFNEVLYLTDTGRRWNSGAANVRDKVNSKMNYRFRSTKDILENVNSLPSQVMLNIHPHRWHDSYYLWTRELLFQNLKNVVKVFVAYKMAGKDDE